MVGLLGSGDEALDDMAINHIPDEDGREHGADSEMNQELIERHSAHGHPPVQNALHQRTVCVYTQDMTHTHDEAIGELFFFLFVSSG